jgi:hypothetical protein
VGYEKDASCAICSAGTLLDVRMEMTLQQVGPLAWLPTRCST